MYCVRQRSQPWPVCCLLPSLYSMSLSQTAHKAKNDLENPLDDGMITMIKALWMFLTVFVRAGWVDCWSVPNFLLIIDYTWHPIYPQKADEQLKQSCKLAALISVLCFPASHVTRAVFLTCPVLSLHSTWLWFLKCLRWRSPCCQLCDPLNTLPTTFHHATPLHLLHPLTAGCPLTPRSCPLTDFM